MAEVKSYRPVGHVDEVLESDGGSAGGGPSGPRLGVVGWLRWMWRQLTSMRVALLLLLLLAVAALPGTFFPQRPQAPEEVSAYAVENPGTYPWLDRFGFFDVYASPWFSAIYLLLFVSLIGCIIPRAAVHIRALRTPPPKAPRRFTRFPVRAEGVVATSPEKASAAVVAGLRGYRVRTETERTGATAISAERGYARETGNIVFHLALVGVLVSVALGSLVHYRGQAIVVEGRSFANSQVHYDSFDAGAWFSPESLEPFRFTLDRFDSEFDELGQARDFTAHVTVTDPDGASSVETIKVNHPLGLGGASVYLQGNGYAPQITVTDGAGEIAFSGPVPFLPQDTFYASRGVVKVPDVSEGLDQLGFNGWFLPTGELLADGEIAVSTDPNPNDPVLVLEMWTGDLGLDAGVPQNVYQLDTDGLEQVMDPDDASQPYRVVLRPGESLTLPDGQGEIAFGELPRFVALDLRYDPTVGWVLVFALLALGGLAASLFLPRRRIWVRLEPGGKGSGGSAVDASNTVVSAAALARGDDPGLRRELGRVLAKLDVPPPPASGSEEEGDA
ncbi:ResB family protein [Beutenbergia cavernae DSM 12333]|uniref:ResB family protein n=1 Tax=Beutenbergia cavernae (strain ATCC BAA-8 / DSM 12333 / CCUG 43141 / JCM 11478 / NBRC 16432 / NCIMB 13614 / HKI 0122) TaxID=471853 RepID=C5C185_BEUC1|nr:cytochrome c biogenesis protein ResB [Beutenbergia cavernae]ACQ81495.1 ResB family protein [Beutenbergia cavernae DSM 12333]